MIRLIIFFFCITQICLSQTETYQFFHLSSEEGLSQSSAIAIAQDNLGQIWIGTRNGLNKFDGNKITVYRNEADNEESLSSNHILSIKQDTDGFIWIGTTDGLNRFNPKTKVFKRYYNERNKVLLKNNNIWDIKEMSDGTIWIGTSSGLFVYNKHTDSFQTFQIHNHLNNNKINRILSIIELKNNSIFLGTDNGLYKLSSKNDNNLRFEIINASKKFFIQNLVESSNNKLLIATKTNGVIEFDEKTNLLSSYFSSEFFKKNYQNVRSLVFDNNQQLWVGTSQGLQIVNRDKKVVLLSNDIANPKSLSHNSIKTLLKEKMGSIWVGTYYGGINIWDKLNDNFFSIKQKPNENGLSYNVVSSIESYNDFIFFGTEGRGLTIQNKKNNSFKHLNINNYPLLKSNNIKSLFLSNNNILWIGTINNGLAFYNPELQKFEKSIIPTKLIDYLKNVSVYSISQDKFNNMWLGTFGRGLIKYNLDSKIFNIFKFKEEVNDSGLNNIIRTLLVDSKQNIWVGTDSGINKIDLNNQITEYLYNFNTERGHRILSVFEDNNKSIWVGTNSNGLYKLVDSSFSHVPLNNNNLISSIYNILEDNKHNLWITTNKGLISYNINNGMSIVYNEKKGVINNEFTENASHKIGESQFYFGGPAGVFYFDSKKINKNDYTPQVILTDFKIGNKSVEIANKNSSTLKKAIEFTKSIELSYKQGNFQISFAMPNFINSSNNSYKYRLKGLEDNWNFTTNNYTSYTIQNAGNYVFEIKGANSDGVWNTETTSLSIKVKPAPWRSWWAFLLYFAGVLMALYGLMGIIKSKVELQNKLNVELEVNKAKLDFFTNISHEFRTPLSLILAPLQQILENYTGNRNVYKGLLLIESSANHLLRLINRLLDFRKFENNFYKLEAAEGNIVKFLKEIYLSFEEFSKNGNYDYNFYSTHDDIQVFYDRYKLERVFYNLISNAFRYTPKNGKISVRISQKNSSVIIQVEDSGVGISKENRDKIFDRFFELALDKEPDRDYNKGTGIGLSIAKNIVEIHKGRIQVESNTDDKGSVFSVTLALGKDHLSDEEIIKDFKFSEDISQYKEQLEKSDSILQNDIQQKLLEEEKQTILLVEDNKELRKFMKSLLKEDYNVLEAENGEKGYKIAMKQQPDLIVSDVVMPVMNGTELCSSLKENIQTSHIPIILLTSRTSLIYKLEGLESGADDYISKPFNIKEFKLRVKNLLKATSTLKEKFSSIDSLLPENFNISSNDEVLLKRVINVVEDNIGNEQFDIALFCSEAGVSRTKLFLKIKEWSDFTPNEFILYYRMKRASELLMQKKINISQISQEVGFKNPKYFSKYFKRKFGMTPKEYSNKFTDSY